MSSLVSQLLEHYISEAKKASDWSAKKKGKTETIALAEIFGISAGLLSQLRNDKVTISHKVIETISNHADKSRKAQVRQELENARARDEAVKNQLKQSRENASVVLPGNDLPDEDALHSLEKFFDTSPDAERLICASYRHMPQSTGKHPRSIRTGAVAIKNGLALAMFQSFGPLDKLKQKAIEALDSENDTEATWTYIYRLAREVRDVYVNIKKEVETSSSAGINKGQLVLYEAAKLSSLAICDIHSRLFYSHQALAGQNSVRVVQLVTGIDKEHFIECDPLAINQSAVAAQFYPIMQYWRTSQRLPVTNEELEKAYHSGDEERIWTIYQPDK